MFWPLLTVELTLCGWILLVLAVDLWLPQERKGSLWAWTLAGIAVCGWLLVSHPLDGAFQDVFVVDGLSRYAKALFLITAAVVVVMTRAFPAISHTQSGAGQHHLPARIGAFYLLLLNALLGMLVLASVQDLLLLFLGLELVTFSLYIMAAYLKSDARAIEAGMKYLVMGSVSSGFLVYGIALLYGFAGSTTFAAITQALAHGPAPLTAQAGMLLLLAGLGFKIAAVPFHLWVPDVYEGAPLPVVALLSAGSKMAGIFALTRVLYSVFPTLSWLWSPALAIMSAATLLYGNLAAIPQTNIKRLLGYSSIGHAGYLLMGLSTGSLDGVAAVGYYLLAYLVSNLTVFLVIAIASDQVGGEALDDYKGLSRRSGFLAAAMFLGLLSLAGVPPLAGFVGKLLVLLRTVESHRLWLVAIGAVNVAISLYYYLMVIKRMYLDAPRTAAPIRVDALSATTLALLIVGILAVGIFQEPFVRLIASAVRF